MSRKLLSLLSLTLPFALAAACGPRDGQPPSGEQGSSESDPAADQIFAADEQFNRETARLGIEGWLEFFAPDGRMVINGAEIVGKEAIREAMGPLLDDFQLEWEPTRAVARAGSDLGYTVGRYRVAPRANPDSLVGAGTYVTIWERQGDGTWKVSLDIGSQDPAPGP